MELLRKRNNQVILNGDSRRIFSLILYLFLHHSFVARIILIFFSKLVFLPTVTTDLDTHIRNTDLSKATPLCGAH